MTKTYISALLVASFCGVQTVRAQESLGDIFAQLDSAGQTNVAVTATQAPAPAAEKPAPEEPAPAPAAEEPAKVAPAPVAKPVVTESEADRLFHAGVKYYRGGEYDKAMTCFNAMLAIDRYDRRAVSYKKRTARAIASKGAYEKRSTRAAAMADVKRGWNVAAKPVAEIDVPRAESSEQSADAAASAALTERIKAIKIPSIEFRDANIKDVVSFLTQACRRLDPEKKGANILLLGMDGENENVGTGITISLSEPSLYEALQYVAEMASLRMEVKPNAVLIMPANYVPASDMVAKVYDIVPEMGSEMTSAAGSGDGEASADDFFGDAASSDADASGPVDVRKFFGIVEFPEGTSATYQPALGKLYVKNTPENVKALEAVLAELKEETIARRSQQVEIEAKFVEFSEGALEELGFDWTLYDNGEFAGFGLDTKRAYYAPGQGPISTFSRGVPTPPGISSPTPYGQTYPPNYNVGTPYGGVLYNGLYNGVQQIMNVPGQSLFGTAMRSNGSAFDTITSGVLSSMGGTPAAMVLASEGSFPVDLRISAMQQEGTADVLSAPKVTVVSGDEATIRVVEQHRYPQDYEVETGQRTPPVVRPTDWEDIDLGVVLRVTPQVDPENAAIDLQLQPEIIKFRGNDLYTVGFDKFETGGDNNAKTVGTGAPLVAQMPFFEKRVVQTAVTVSDGSTVVMGGLVDERTETFRDQVPILGDIPYVGRLFRTEGSRTSKKNLVIFVKATQVDENGMTRRERDLVRANATN